MSVLTAAQRVKLARSVARPGSMDFIHALFTDVFYGETPDFIRNIEYCESKSKTPLL